MDRQDQLLELLDRFADAWNRHDLDALMSMMTDDCVFQAYAGPQVDGQRSEGKPAVRANAAVFETFHDAHWANARHFIAGNRGVSEWTFTGTRADGTRVEVAGCDLITFRDGRIAVKNSYRKNRVMKTKPTKASVRDFIAAVTNDTRREDLRTLLKLFAEVTGWKAQMLGPNIVGFGLYHYKYASGHSGAACVIGFSREQSLVIYVFDFEGKAELLKKLGKHKGGLEQCLYINKLADVDLAVLKRILKGGVAEAKRSWPVTAS